MMRSMYSGVSGLKTHQTKMDVIGNNIANVNTVSYKSQSITFSELMYQTTQQASGANALTGTGGTNARQIGLGVQSAAISTAITSQGATQTTGNPFDICITGESFFIVNDGSSNFFTRAGAFNIDSVGNLVMASNGYNVMGWGVDESTGEVKQDIVSPLRIMSADNMTYPPEATTLSYVSGIIDKNDVDAASEGGKLISLSFYDELGYAYTAKLSVHNTNDEGEYYVQLDDVLNAKGVSIVEAMDASRLSDIITMGGPVTVSAMDNIVAKDTLSVSSAGDPPVYTLTEMSDPLNPTTLVSSDVASASWATADPVEANTYTIAYNTMTGAEKDSLKAFLTKAYGITEAALENVNELSLNFATMELNVTNKNVVGSKLKYNTNNGEFDSIGEGTSIVLEFKPSYNKVTDPATPMPLGQFKNIEMDWKATSMFNNSGTSTIGITSGDKNGLGTGRKLGSMTGITIQTNGMIYASYDNGMTRLMGQIAVGEFTNPAGLEKAGDNLYKASLNSGEFDGIGVDITGSGGYMTTGVLEMSNVDLSAEFTEMITTQRGFQANSRIITVSDTMLEELVNLKR